MAIADTTLPGMLKLLADPTRLRMLSLLEQEELTVGELSRSLGMTQSRVSNHLRILRDASLLHERHAGQSTHLRLRPATNGHAPIGRLWNAMRDDLDALPERAADQIRLDQVLTERRKKDGDFFDRMAGEWDKIAGAFTTGQAMHRAAVHLLPADFVIADLGCGTGYMTQALLGTCRRIIAVDQSEAMLAEAGKRLGRAAERTELEFRQGELDALPLADNEVDGVIAGMVLHHLPESDAAIAEMYRVLKPGGTASVLELAPHREAWMREELSDRHLGLNGSDIVAAFKRAGFEDVNLDPITDAYRPPHPDGREVTLPLYIVRGRKPAPRTAR